MPRNSPGAIKMICKNPNCPYKGIVYRKFDVMRDQICKNCKQPLSTVLPDSYKKLRDNKAKDDLKSFGLA